MYSLVFFLIIRVLQPPQLSNFRSIEIFNFMVHFITLFSLYDSCFLSLTNLCLVQIANIFSSYLYFWHLLVKLSPGCGVRNEVYIFSYVYSIFVAQCIEKFTLSSLKYLVNFIDHIYMGLLLYCMFCFVDSEYNYHLLSIAE